MDAWEDSFQCQEFFAMVFDLQSNFSLGLREKKQRGKLLLVLMKKVCQVCARCWGNPKNYKELP